MADNFNMGFDDAFDDNNLDEIIPMFDDTEFPEELIATIATDADKEFEKAVEHMYRPNESIFGAVARDMVKTGWSVFPQEIDGNRRPGTVDGRMIKWSEDHKLATQLPTDAALDKWTAQCAALNVAVVLGSGSGDTLVLDVDIVEPELSRMVQELADKMFGYTPFRRIGNWPKIALVYRHAPEDEVPNRSPKFVPFETPENPDSVDQGLEVISHGKPMTFFGKHHKTGRYFQWLDANPQFFGPEDAPLVTSQQINDFFDAVDSLRQFSKSASFDGTIATWEWDENAQINVPKIRSSAGAKDWTEDKEGKVVDGREAYLTRLAFRIVTANPGTSTTPQGRETLVKIVVQQFIETAECSGRWKGNNLIREAKSKVNRTADKMKAGQIQPFVPVRDSQGDYIIAATARDYVPAQPRNPDGDSLDFLPPFVDPTAFNFNPNTPNQRRPMKIEVLEYNEEAFESRKIEEDRTRIAKTVQDGLLKAFNSFWDEVYDMDRRDTRIHILKAPTGAGKTSRGISFVAEDKRTKDDYTIYGSDGEIEHQGRCPVLFLLPTYDNIEELKSRSEVLNLDPDLNDEDLRAQAEALGLIHIDALEGKLKELRRDAKNAGLTTMLYQGKLRAGCEMKEKMEIAMAAGMGTSRLCKAEIPTKDKDENGKTIMDTKFCPYYEGCPAITQKEQIQNSHVVFLPHAFLALNIPDELKHVRAVVADERIHHLFLHTTEFDLDIFTSPRKPPKLTKKEKEAGEDPTTFNPLRLKAAGVVNRALLTNKDPAEELLKVQLEIIKNLPEKMKPEARRIETERVYTWIKAALRTCGASLQRDGDITPEIDMEQLRELCSQPTGVQVREEHRFWKIVEERYLMRLEEYQNERLSPNFKRKTKGEKDYRIQYVEDVRSNGEPHPKIRISWRDTPNWVNRPMLLLDASAAPAMISKIWSGKDVQVHDIPAALNVRTVAIADRTYSNSSVIAAPSASAQEKQSSARILTNIRRAISSISALYGWSRTVAGGSILVRKAVNTAWEGPHNVDWCHFGAMRGLDFAKYHSAAISIGRMELPVRTLDGLVASLTYDDDEPEKPFDSLGTGLGRDNQPLRIPTGTQRVKMRSGHDINMPVPMFPGKWGRMIQRQYREEELLQFLGRLRPVYREGMAPIWFSLSSVIPEEVIVDDLINMDDLIKANTGSVWEAMRRSHGILDSRIATDICDDLFATRERVCEFMKKMGMNDKTGDIDQRIAWGIVAYRWKTKSGESGHSFVRADLKEREEALRNALEKHMESSLVSLEQLSTPLPQTLAMGRKVDKIEDALGTLDNRRKIEQSNAIESAIAILMTTPAEAIAHLRANNLRNRQVPVSVPSGITYENSKKGPQEGIISLIEAETRLAISKLWTSLGKDKPEKNDLGAEAAIVHAETGVNTNESYENAAAATDDGLREFQIMAFDTEDEMIPF
jgi:ribosomal protein L17